MTRFFREPESFEALATHVFPAARGGPARRRADPDLGVRLRDRRGGLLDRDRAARVPRRSGRRDPGADLRDRRQRERDRGRAQRRLPASRSPRTSRPSACAASSRASTAATASQARARPLRLRAPGPVARPAVLEARPDPLPQRADLHERDAAAQADVGVPLRAEAERLPDARERRDDRRARAISSESTDKKHRLYAKKHADAPPSASFPIEYAAPAPGRGAPRAAARSRRRRVRSSTKRTA